MKIIKRILVSFWNQPFKAFMLYIITFFLCIFVSCSISVCDFSNRLSTIIKQQIGAHVYLPSTHSGIVWPKNSEKYVEYTVQEMDLCNKLIQLQNRNDIEYLEIYSKLAGSINGDYIDDDGNNINDEFISIHYIPMIDSVLNEIDILSGREFTIDEMKGSYKIIVDERLKHKNGSKVQVGDILTFKYEVLKTVFNEDFTNANSIKVFEETFAFEVVGLYHMNPIKESSKILLDGSNYNALYSYYIPYETLKQVGERINELEETIGDNQANYGDVRMISAYFKLKDPELLKTFINEIKIFLPKNQDYRIYSSLDDYYLLAAPLERLSIVGIVLFLFASIAFVILFSLIINENILLKSKEIGTLLSLGEQKRKIIFRYVGEILLICNLSFISSIFIGNEIGRLFVNSVLVDATVSITYEVSKTFMYNMILLLEGNVVLILASIMPFIKLFKSNLRDLIG